MIYGLNGIDLNLKAQLALAGLSDTPEQDVAELFKSGHPIEDHTRRCLVAALEGAASTIHLKAAGKNRAKHYRAIQLRRKHTRIGREVINRSLVINYGQAVNEAAEFHLVSVKSIEAYVTLCRKLFHWIAEVRKENIREDLSDLALEVVFLYAHATNREPAECLRPAAGELADVIMEIEELWRQTETRRHP